LWSGRRAALCGEFFQLMAHVAGQPLGRRAVGSDDARGEERGPLAGGRTRLPPLTNIPSKSTVEPGDRGYPKNLG
jgi:hypothetical protein